MYSKTFFSPLKEFLLSLAMLPLISLAQLSDIRGTEMIHMVEYAAEPVYIASGKSKPLIAANEFHEYRLSLRGGLAHWFYRLADIPESAQTHYSDLRNGIHFGGDFTWFPGAQVGLGARYEHFMSESATLVSFTPQGETDPVDAELNNEVTLRFIGPQAAVRYYSDDSKRAFIMGIAMGYADYTNTGTFTNFLDAGVVKGNNVGILADFSGDFYLSDYFGLGVGLTFCMSKISKVETTQTGGVPIDTNLNRRDQISTTYIALNVGLRLLR